MLPVRCTTGCAFVLLRPARRFAVENNAATAAAIWDKPGERWFTETDPIWRVHADSSMSAGIRALLLQSLHRWPWRA